MQRTLYLGLGMLMILTLASPALAQDETVDTETAETETTEQTPTEETNDTGGETEEIEFSEEADQDETVTEEDLEAETPGRFHFLTKIKRTVRRTITRDPIKKAEYRIEEANEELLRAKKLVEEQPDDAKAQEKVGEAVEKYQEQIEKIKERADDIKEKRADRADEFMQKITDMQVKQQKVLNNLEERVPERVFIKIKENREQSLRHFGETMSRVSQNPEHMAENIDIALSRQAGSDFKEFKNMEVIGNMREFMPEEARAAMDKAQESARIRFEEHISQLPEEARDFAFKNYVQNVNGDPIRHMKILGDIKSKGDLPEDFFKHVEIAREHAINKFEDRFRRFGDPENREKLIQNLASGNVEDLRILQEMQSNMPEDIKAEIKQQEEESIRRFKENFADDPDAQRRADKFRELAAKIRENPDPTTFALIQKLEDEMPESQKAFIRELEHEASQGFEEQFLREQGRFLERIQSFDPNAIEHLQQFQANVPADVQELFNRAINQQTDFSFERFEEIEDPASFDRFRRKFEDNPEIQQRIEFRHGDFDARLEQKNGEIDEARKRMEAEFRQRFDPGEFEPGDRGEFRREEVRPENFDENRARAEFEERQEFRTEDGRTEFRREVEVRDNGEVRERVEFREDRPDFREDDFRRESGDFRPPEPMREELKREFEQRTDSSGSGSGDFREPEADFRPPQDAFQPPPTDFRPPEDAFKQPPPPDSTSGGSGSFTPPPPSDDGSFSDGGASASPPPQ